MMYAPTIPLAGKCTPCRKPEGKPVLPLVLATVAVLIAHAVGMPPAVAADRPNIVLALADDLGYGDLGCYGHPHIKTPHLDRLAADGLRLTSCYAAAANCSPSRTGLMTGRTPYRVGVHNWIPFMSPVHLKAEEITVARLLREAGYDTCHVGKWHLNGLFNLPGQPQPSDHGFAHWFSTQNNALPNHQRPYNFVRNGIPMGPQEGYSSAIVAGEAIRWLREVRDKSKPFFLFVCFHEPHEPIATDPRFARAYDYPDDPSRHDPSRSAYYGNVSQMDDAFGRLMAALDGARLRESTLVFFTSDNGPARTRYHNAGSAVPLRGVKGELYEGGIRVPGIIRWPGKTKPGSTSAEPVCGVDFLPTACEIAGIALPKRKLDGASMVGVLSGKPVSRTVPLYWQFNWAASEPRVAVRSGDWKVLAGLDASPPRTNDLTDETKGVLKTAKLQNWHLYDLRSDEREQHDLATRNPDKLAELSAMLKQQFLEVQQQTPTWPAWKFPGYEGKRIKWPEYRAKPTTAGK